MKAQEIKFGVEVECYLPSRVRSSFPVGSYHHGLQVVVAPEGWNAQADGSLGAGCPEGYFPAEIVSPVLSGEEGLCQVYYVIDLLESLEAKVNACCGLHVHVDARGFTSTEIDNIVANFLTWEKAFYALCGVNASVRWANPYCKNSSRWHAADGRGDRYQSLNVTNWQQYRSKATVEFRVWQSTLNVGEVIAAVYMAVSFVAKAKEGLWGLTLTEAARPTLTQTVKQFIKTFWLDTDNLIVPDEKPADLTRILQHNARIATI